jgi:riboflavin transporter FmnP
MSNKIGINKKGNTHLGTKKITVIAMFIAIAFVMVSTIRIPMVAFLHYEPKDTIIAIAGLIYGPLFTVIISVICSFIEMVTISVDGYIGMIMNIISTCSFATTAAIIYRKLPKKISDIVRAIIGLTIGLVFMVVVMLLWNYFLTPIYMGVPRNVVALMLPTTFLPFNLIKGTLNMVFTLVLYKAVGAGLRRLRAI